jgi:UDP-GlcNAc:undecaprenyl-phosphate/decaprenyl-phosphate GlcNAc-1-phosphate transferase
MTFFSFRIIFTTLLISLALGLPAFWLAPKLRLLDFPEAAPHKLHHNPMPLVGGLVIFLTVLLGGLFQGAFRLPVIGSLILPAAIVFIFGLWDDLRGLSAPWKLIGQLIAATLMILLGIQIRLFDQLPWLNLLITYLWMIGITNAFNFVDSMDGLATGLGILAAGFFMLVTYDSEQIGLSLFSAILVGACLGSFYYTASPAKFFLGDSGAQFLGFILAGLAIEYSPLGFLRTQSWFVPILLVGVPIFDTSLVVVSRLRRRKPVYRAGLDHTYHRLVKLGLNSNRAVLTMHFVAILLGCLAFIALSLPPMVANTIFLTVVVFGIALLFYLDRQSIWP